LTADGKAVYGLWSAVVIFRGSFTMNQNIRIIAMDKIVEIENVGAKPLVSAIQPPMSGAMMVAGAVSVCASPM
jgi:hypothetical protein